LSVPAAKAIRVEGIVQGVGFRPFVYNLAVRLGLTGDVNNNSQGVFIRLFGETGALDEFLRELGESPPPLASITNISVSELSEKAPIDFRIIHSSDTGARTVCITPEASTCADCRRELLDPRDRRFRYAFINCTNCGPRYTIILDVPYDRPKTTMSKFVMCDACQAEYEDPPNRRYHAQPNCCADCGPALELLDEGGRAIPGDPLTNAADLLKAGKIVAVKGLGGFHLACDAKNETAVVRMRKRKLREEKPFAVMVPDFAAAQALVEMPEYGKRVLEGPIAPILIARKKTHDALAPSVAPVNDYFGVMTPYTPIHVLLFAEDLEVLVMTSANRTDEPICIDNDEAFERLSGIADAFLLHDREINLRIDDSVLMATDEKPTLTRRARGYVPSAIETGVNTDSIAAFGPLLKNTFSLGRGTGIYVSQHIGDLDTKLAIDMFHEVYDHLTGILGIKVKEIACDMHPDYPSTHLAAQTGLPVTEVQHHHAHLASIMAEKRIYERAIGFALDGAGYGDDGEIWGGEVMVFDPGSYSRKFHLDYVPLPGGDMAAKEPWRMALSYLESCSIDYRKYVRQPQAETVAALLRSDIRQFRTSSLGRLFDAVSSLCGLCHFATFEAKAPMLLEGALEPVNDRYEFELAGDRILTEQIIRGVVRDVDAGAAPSIISGRFHNTVVEFIVACAEAIRADGGLDTVFLSGGVMMNAYLARHIRRRLRENGFNVHTHTILPPNDGGVSAGQLLVAAWRRAQ